MLILYKYAQTALIMFKFLLNALIFPSFAPTPLGQTVFLKTVAIHSALYQINGVPHLMFIDIKKSVNIRIR